MIIMKLPLYSLLQWWREPAGARQTAVPKTTFQFMSDLHLEVGQQYATFEVPVAASARYLILAGDIGRLVDYEGLTQFLRRQTAVFETVFLVLGNHEFYGLSYDEGTQKARELAASVGDKLVLLQQGHHVIRQPARQVHVLGCTLWSQIPEERKADVAARVQDFSKITGWSVDAHNEHHEEDLAWLKRRLAAVREEAEASEERVDVVVVTHHAPCVKGTSSPQHVTNPWTCAFATDLLGGGSGGDKLWLSMVRWWVFGHTHYTSKLRLGRLTLISNQRGYVLPGAAAVTMPRKGDAEHEFDPARVLQL